MQVVFREEFVIALDQLQRSGRLPLHGHVSRGHRRVSAIQSRSQGIRLEMRNVRIYKDAGELSSDTLAHRTRYTQGREREAETGPDCNSNNVLQISYEYTQKWRWHGLLIIE
jgi:hypothetical protein